MHIQDIFAADRTTFSFEFFPPQTDGPRERLFATIAQLQSLRPSFVSVTYGAGGSTRERTHDLIVRIQNETRLTAVSHLTCVCHSREELAAILDRYADSGIENILALGGDPPRNRPDYDRSNDAFQYAEQPRPVHPVASATRPTRAGSASASPASPRGTPARPTASRRWTISSGRSTPGPITSAPSSSSRTATSTTSASAASWPASACRSSPGSCRSTRKADMVRMAELALGARFPGKLLRAVDRCDDDRCRRKVGIHWATEQCRDLLDNQVRGIHFYTLNQSDATRQIYENLGVKDSVALRVG